MKKQFAVILCGSGFQDGTEIHEAVCTLLALENAGAHYQCFSPVGPQSKVIDHFSGDPLPDEERSMITEAARIARGEIKDLKELNASHFDGLIVPGGYGTVCSLCDFAVKGSDCSVRSDVADVIESFYAAQKPMGFICIAPVIAAKVLGIQKVELTIGNDESTAAALEQMGAVPFEKSARDIHIDSHNRIVSTPGYMSARGIADVYAGVTKLVAALVNMVDAGAHRS